MAEIVQRMSEMEGGQWGEGEQRGDSLQNTKMAIFSSLLTLICSDFFDMSASWHIFGWLQNFEMFVEIFRSRCQILVGLSF